MQQHPQSFDFSGLTVGDRIELAMALWDSVRDTVDEPLTPAQHEELNRRIAAIDAGEMPFSPWEEVKERLLAQLHK